jgi:peroxiredoxin/uncharacterized membrane protein YphA (DoxX/SURF4 family)
MGLALLLSRVVLAAVFAVAAISKLRDFQGTRSAVVAFGLPDFLATFTAVSLPTLELATVALLLASRTAWIGALCSSALLVTLTTAIVANMARGKHPDCHCFGQLYSEPISAGTLARNSALLLISGLLLLELRENPGLTFTFVFAFLLHHLLLTLGTVFASVLITVQFWISFQLLRQNGRLLLRIEALEEKAFSRGSRKIATHPGPRIGTPAPAFSLTGVDVGNVSLQHLLAIGKPVLLLFADPNCGPCKALVPDVANWLKRHAEKLTVALISRGEAKANRVYVQRYGLAYVLLQKDREVASSYQGSGTPSAIVVGPDGRIYSPLASGAPAITELLAKVAEGRLQVPQPSPSQKRSLKNSPAPSFSLPDIEGKFWTLAEFFGSSTLIVFWNPDCGFCKKMLPDLKHWERQKQKTAPRLALISSGFINQNAATDLLLPVLLDSDRQVMNRFGASGTPSALLIDSKGIVASDLAVGATAIFKLVADSTPIMFIEAHSGIVEARPGGNEGTLSRIRVQA